MEQTAVPSHLQTHARRAVAACPVLALHMDRSTGKGDR